ncbi:MAG: efflux RND transporter permease subunit [Candidatus Delongbacteria bacterium]|nr:efflux RND transporter permease subunit [Candidatus Delongbacteria bacterium]MBN2835687.1 efflux RND transporter permease subunit [Candidatus Delongbacteria bacterium]
MSITDKPVNRPILTFVIYLIVIILGSVSFYRLSIDLMPEITYPTISIFANYGNVGPEEIEEIITRPIEESLSAVSGVESITSTSSEGECRIRVMFGWGTDLDIAANDIRDRMDRVSRRLPDDLEKPTIRKFDMSAAPVMEIGVSSDLNPIELRKIVDDQVKYRIERVAGVASSDIRGGLNREIHVEIDAVKLKAYSLELDDIKNAMANDNQNIPAGEYEKGSSKVLVRTLGEYKKIDEIENTIIKQLGNNQIRIKNVAKVVDSWEDVDQIVRVNGQLGLRISISKQSGANTVNVVDAVNSEIVKINEDLKQIQLVTLFDSAKYIKQSINNISLSAVWGGFLVVIILFIFLRNVASTLIIATAIPISMIATFGLMYFGGFTLNIITFGGLALGIGMLLDSSIVVLENIYRHREEGENLKESAIKGTKEVVSALFSSVLTTIVVFFPVIFVRGMSGIIFKQMAYVVSFSLFCSFIVALTLIPVLSSRYLHTEKELKKGASGWKKRIYELSEKLFQNIENRYKNLLSWSLDNRKKLISIFTIMLIVSLFLIRGIGVELMPSADEGQVRVSYEMAAGTKLEIVDEISLKIESIITKNVPEAVSTMSRIEPDGGDVRVQLLPKAERNRSSDEIANSLRKKLANIPGTTIRTRSGQGLFFMRMMQSSDDNLSIEIRGYDLKTAQNLAIEVESIVKSIEGVTDTKISRSDGNPEEILLIDREKAASLHLNVYDIGKSIQSALSGTSSSYFRENGKQYKILLRYKESDRSDIEKILDMNLLNSSGVSIPVRTVIKTELREGPSSLERKNQERIITVSANFIDRDLGSIIKDTRAQLSKLTIPKDFAIIFGGDYEEQQKAFSELILGFILAIILVYLVMAGQFESFLDPFVILFSIPMAIIGIVITMIATGTVFSMQAFIGCIMLAGIVVNNAILLVDYTNQLRELHGMDLYEAIKTAGVRRLRPILMTTSTTVLGLLPLSFGLGEGGESQAPLARVVIGGLASSTLITLVLIPVLYSLFEQKVKRIKH